jgi:hypothetical protein
MNVAQEIFCFVRMHWIHILIAPVMALLVTVIHESAHSSAVIAQGGTVTMFSWLPAAGHWGFMNYEFPEGRDYSAFAISIAPYCVWLVVAATTFCTGLACRKLPFWLASSLFVWGYVVPLGDIANTALPYLAGFENDFRHAFGRPNALMAGMISVLALVTCLAGYPLQRRLYGEQRLSLASYMVLVGFCAAGIAGVAGVV